MPTTFRIVMSTKTGTPEPESSGTTCTLEVDDDSPTLRNPEALQRAIRSAIAVCKRALHEEEVWQPSVSGVVTGLYRGLNALRAEP
jgi:hypothetical protein